MQVSFDVIGPLQRRVRVQIPEGDISTAVQSRLRDLARSSSIAGFRPGKAPLKMIERRFGAQVRGEVLGEVERTSFRDAVIQEKLRPASEPSIARDDLAPGSGLSYTATFEVFPEVTLAPFENMTIEKPVCTITDADIDRMIETLRRQNRTWQTVKRAAALGDVANVDFVGTVDGEPFEGGEAQGIDVELGASRFMKGFEEALVGGEAGADVEADVTFPSNHMNEALAGKDAHFKIKINRVSEARLPEVNEAFFRQLGVKEGGIDTFRGEVAQQMERNKDGAVHNLLKDRVLTALRDANPLDLPNAAVQQEAIGLCEQAQANMLERGVPRDSVAGVEPEMFVEEARRRVATGLLLGDICARNGLKADPARVQGAVEGIAGTFEQPAAVVKWYYEDRSRLRQIEIAILEEAAVDWVLTKVQVTEVPVTFDALTNPGQTGQAP